MRRHDRREDVVAAVARGAVAVLPAVVRGEEGVEGGEEVVVAAGARFDDGDACRGVRDEEVEEAVAAVGDLAQEGLAVAGEVGDALGGACGDVQDSGREDV